MKKEDAIKFLQQLYPNGGHCWLDEQRIEAIGMAVKALQEEPVELKEVDLENYNKVQKIREEVARIQLYTQSEVLKQVLDYIDKVQEEPVIKIWHYQKKEPVNEIADKSRPIIVVYGNNSLNAAGKFRYYEDNSDAIWLSNSYEKWAFVEDLINLSHSVTKVSWQEESVSDDLGEYINELSKQFPEVSFAKLSRIAVRVAKWQKEQMMKDAVDGEIYFNLDSLQYRIITEPLTDYHHGDKIKLIIVKED